MINIDRFVQKLSAAESKRQKEVVLTIDEARKLHAEITAVLSGAITIANDNDKEEVIQVELRGSDF